MSIYAVILEVRLMLANTMESIYVTCIFSLQYDYFPMIKLFFFSTGLKGGPLSDEYVLEQFHCHWGKTNETGSEHTVNGHCYSGEVMDINVFMCCNIQVM